MDQQHQQGPVVYNNAQAAVPRAVQEGENQSFIRDYEQEQQQEQQQQQQEQQQQEEQQGTPCKKCPFTRCGKVGKMFCKAFMVFNIMIILSQIFIFPGSCFYSALSVGIVGYIMAKKVFMKYGKAMLDEEQQKKVKKMMLGGFLLGTGFLIAIASRLPIVMVPGILYCGILTLKSMKNCKKYNTTFHRHLVTYIMVATILLFTVSSFKTTPCRTAHYYGARREMPQQQKQQQPFEIEPLIMHVKADTRNHKHPHRPSKPEQPAKPEQPKKPEQPAKPEQPIGNHEKHRHRQQHHHHSPTFCHVANVTILSVHSLTRLFNFVWAVVLLIHFFIHRRNKKRQETTLVLEENYSYPSHAAPQPQQQQQQQYTYPSHHTAPQPVPQAVVPQQPAQVPTTQPMYYPSYPSYPQQQQQQQQINTNEKR